jgi:hypothetical protein
MKYTTNEDVDQERASNSYLLLRYANKNGFCLKLFRITRFCLELLCKQKWFLFNILTFFKVLMFLTIHSL